MEPIKNQMHFENLFRNPEPFWIPENSDEKITLTRRLSDYRFIVYFTASWCKPCKKLDRDLIVAKAKESFLPIYICDAEENEYTPGFCGVRSFPTFVLFALNKQINTITTSSTDVILKWIELIEHK